MRDPRAATGAPSARRALAAVAVALFGLLSMHGWGSHAGSHPMATAPQGTTVMKVAASGDGVPDHATMTGEETATTAASGHPTLDHQAQAPDDGRGGALLGLCVAVLTALLFGIALAVARRSTRTPRGLLPMWPHLVLVGRDHDPPDLLRLCVIRC